jgi:hypothetical protein
MIRLDVGGVLYHTSADTLTRIPNTYFTALLSGHFEHQQYIFIDRDGLRFKHILNYLRNNNVNLPKAFNKIHKYEEIIEEAEYFGINELADLLRKEIRTITNQAKIEQLRAASVAAAAAVQTNMPLIESPSKRKRPNVFSAVPLIGPDRFSSPRDMQKKSPRAPKFAPMLEDFPEVENFTEDF